MRILSEVHPATARIGPFARDQLSFEQGHHPFSVALAGERLGMTSHPAI
jgi:hypothetical protein